MSCTWGAGFRARWNGTGILVLPRISNGKIINMAPMNYTLNHIKFGSFVNGQIPSNPSYLRFLQGDRIELPHSPHSPHSPGNPTIAIERASHPAQSYRPLPLYTV